MTMEYDYRHFIHFNCGECGKRFEANYKGGGYNDNRIWVCDICLRKDKDESSPTPSFYKSLAFEREQMEEQPEQ